MKEGQDLENQVAHPQQEHLRSTPLVGAYNTLRDLHWEYMCTPTTYPLLVFFFGPHRDTKMCRELVGQHGVKILNTYDSHGHTPLHWAALGGYSELIKFFLNCGVDVNRQSRSDYGPYPIHWACVNGHILCVDLLIQNGASIDCTDNKGCTPLIISAQYGKAMLAGYLVGKGAKSFFTDHEGDNALHWACFKGEHFLTFYGHRMNSSLHHRQILTLVEFVCTTALKSLFWAPPQCTRILICAISGL